MRNNLLHCMIFTKTGWAACIVDQCATCCNVAVHLEHVRRFASTTLAGLSAVKASKEPHAFCFIVLLMGHVVKENAKFLKNCIVKFLNVPCVASLTNGMLNRSAY